MSPNKNPLKFYCEICLPAPQISPYFLLGCATGNLISITTDKVLRTLDGIMPVLPLYYTPRSFLSH